MESTRPESLLYSPSVKKPHRQRTPRKSTPKRLYLRQSFPTLGSPPSTTPHSSPGDAFKQRQQLLQDAQDEQEEQDQQVRRLLDNNRRQQAAHDGSPVFVKPSQPPAKASDTIPASSIHARQAQEISDALARVLEKTSAAKSRAKSLAANNPTVASASAAPRLRTTETEYDVSPDRSTRLLSTPPRSLYSGTPSRLRHMDELPESDALPSSPFVSSPLDRHSRNRQIQQEQEKMLRNNAALFGRESTLRDELARAPEWPSHRTLAQEEEEVNDQGDLFHAIHDRTEGAVQGAKHDDDDEGYDRGDDEVSFKRPELASYSNLSTLVDPDSNHEQYQLYSPHEKTHREPQDYERGIQQDHRFSVHEPTPARAFSQQSAIRTPVQNGYTAEREAEDSLLEVAEKTAVITEELRGVYSNLQEFFSPETEAKLSGAMTVLNSHKRAGSADRAVNDRRFSASVPKPLVFETSPVTVQKVSPITKRKPAPLRPAIMPTHRQHQQQKHQHQQHQQQEDQRESPAKVHKYDVTLRGLVSDADSARRLSQGKRDKDRRPRRSLDSIQASRPSTIPATLSEQSNFGNEPPGEKYQERFQRKLDRWKRVERQNLAEAPPLPTYLDLYIPTTSSRSHLQTDYEDEYLEVDYQDEDEERLEREGAFEEDLEQEQQLERTLYREQLRQDLLDMRTQTAREGELRERRARRAAEEAEDYEELADRRHLSKRRREADFWS